MSRTEEKKSFFLTSSASPSLFKEQHFPEVVQIRGMRGFVGIQHTDFFVGNAIFQNCLFSGSFGAIVLSKDATVSFEDCEFHCIVSGVFVKGKTEKTTIVGCRFESAVYSICGDECSTVEIRNCVFEPCLMANIFLNNGGQMSVYACHDFRLFATEKSIFDITNCTFTAMDNPVVYGRKSYGQIKGCRFEDCNLAIQIRQQKLSVHPVEIQECEFRANRVCVSICWSNDTLNVFAPNAKNRFVENETEIE